MQGTIGKALVLVAVLALMVSGGAVLALTPPPTIDIPFRGYANTSNG